MSATTEYACKMPVPSVPFVDPVTGLQSREWFRWSLQIMARTGGLAGIGSSDVQATANAAQSTANTAQTTADTGVANAATAQATANTAQASATTAQGTANTGVTNAATAQATADANTAAIATETAARIAADALLAPLASPHFTGNVLVAGGIGVWGHASPGAQPATPVTTADIIALLQSYGFCS